MSEDTTEPRIGIILSSGGIRGVYAHTGFLLWLKQQNINIRAVAGCSAGAIVGGILASGRDIQDWANTLKEVTPDRFWSPAWGKLFWSFLFNKGRGYTGLSSPQAAIEFCRSQLKVQLFEECKIPFDALAIHLVTGRKTLFNKGELATRMVASGAIPLLYQPVKIEGEYYCDGAVQDLAPTEAICCKHQLDIVLVHHVAQRDKGESGLKNILRRPWTLFSILNLLIYQQRPWYLSDEPLTFRHCPCGCGAIIIVVEPELPECSWPVTNKGNKVVQAALEQTRDLFGPYLEDIKNSKATLENKIIIEPQMKSEMLPSSHCEESHV